MLQPNCAMGKAERVRLALDGKLAQRDLTLDEARRIDAEVAVRIDDAVARADFASAPRPDFAAAAPDPHRVLADLASRAESSARRQHRAQPRPR